MHKVDCKLFLFDDMICGFNKREYTVRQVHKLPKVMTMNNNVIIGNRQKTLFYTSKIIEAKK
jgi:hypothetical protein